MKFTNPLVLVLLSGGPAALATALPPNAAPPADIARRAYTDPDTPAVHHREAAAAAIAAGEGAPAGSEHQPAMIPRSPAPADPSQNGNEPGVIPVKHHRREKRAGFPAAAFSKRLISEQGPAARNPGGDKLGQTYSSKGSQYNRHQ